MTWVPFTESEASAFEAELRACLGMKWRHMGRAGCGYGHQTGLDCVGLLQRAFRKVGRPLSDIATYGREADGSLESRIAARLGKPAAGYGTRRVALIKVDGVVRHVGYITDAGTIIHSRRGAGGGVVEHAIDPALRGDIVRSWSL